MPTTPRMDALNRLQRLIPKVRGPLGGPLSPEVCDLLRKFIVDPAGAWPFLRSMPLEGGETTLGERIRRQNPGLSPHDLPNLEAFFAALSA